jgi:ubiquinone/menaquinone biosynthesis C-methylase UbiE
MDQRLERERQFHNLAFGDNTREPTAKFYSIVGRSREFYIKTIEQLGQGKEVLEYGCGTGSYAFHLGRKNSRVTGIDISDIAIAQATDAALKLGLGDRVGFRLMNAEALKLSDGSFDLICGTGILHHLDLSKAFAEIRRVLKPSGYAVFVEPLGHNPLIEIYRRLTPGMRSQDEHPLRVADLELAKDYFGEVRAHYFHLNSLAAVPFRGLRNFPQMVDALDTADDVLFRILPFARRFAWRVVLIISKPVAMS